MGREMSITQTKKGAPKDAPFMNSTNDQRDA